MCCDLSGVLPGRSLPTQSTLRSGGLCAIPGCLPGAVDVVPVWSGWSLRRTTLGSAEVWGTWTEWSECSRTCDGGQKLPGAPV